MRGTSSDTPIAPLSEDERFRRQRALAEAARLREMLLRERGGEYFPSAADVIHEARRQAEDDSFEEYVGLQ